MSLIDQLLSQQIVLISVGVFFLFIAAAIGVAVYPRIKTRRAKIAKRKAAEKAAKEAAVTEAKAAKEAARAARRGGRQAAAAEANGTAPAGTGAPAAGSGAAPAGTPAAAGAAPAAGGTAPAAAAPKPPLLAATPAASTTTETKEEVSPEMQDLLSSVFSDEENSERQQILLQGTESVSIDELLTLSKSVMAQINGEQQSNIVRVKEKELS